VAKLVARICGAIAASLMCLSASAMPAQAAQAGRATPAPGWRLTNVYGRGAANIDPPFSGGLTATSRGSAWSIFSGCTWPCNPGKPTTVVRHWNGHRWTAVPAAELHGLSPYLVTASSANDAWLFGPVPNGRGVGVLHWTGHHWSKQPAPAWVIRVNGSGEASLYAADFSQRDLWMFSQGSYIGQRTAFAAHFQNGRWTKSYLPDVPESTAAVSSSDIWSIGQAFNGKGAEVLMHWNGHRWKTSDLPKQRNDGYAFGLTAVGAGGLWAVWQPLKAGVKAYLLHFTRGHWIKVNFPATGSGYPQTGDGAGGLWLSGFASGHKRVQLFLHLSRGHWTTAKTPNSGYSPGNVDELALIPGTRSVWAIGNVYGPGDGETLNRGAIWRYNP
jgi:hypothetical protein